MFIKSKNFQRLLKFHKILGLFLSLHILLLALTGVILVFRPELNSWLHAEAPTGSAPIRNSPIPLQSLVDKVLQDHPKDRLLAINIDEDHPEKISLRIGAEGSKLFRGARKQHFNQRTGEDFIEQKPGFDLLQNILVLHREVFLGGWGKLYIGFLGLIYAFILISGFLIYGPFMKRLRFGTIRRHLHPKIFWTDLHKYFGAFTFAWSLVIGLTGFFLGWSSPMLKLYQATALKSLTSEFANVNNSKPLVSVDKALQTAQTSLPESRFTFVAFPDTEFSTPHHYIFIMEGSTPFSKKLSDLVLVDAHDGTLGRVLVLPLYLKILLLSEPLHFGDYGGWPLKIIWALFGVSSMVLPVSGLRIFWKKFRLKTDTAVIIPTQSQPISRPYSTPFILIVVTWIGILLALWVEGTLDSIASVLLLGVMLFALYQRRALA